MPFLVTRHAKTRFEVTGIISIVAGRRANEPYSRVFTTRRAAEYDAAIWDAANAEALDWQARRRKDVLTRRAAHREMMADRRRSRPVQVEMFCLDAAQATRRGAR